MIDDAVAYNVTLELFVEVLTLTDTSIELIGGNEALKKGDPEGPNASSVVMS